MEKHLMPIFALLMLYLFCSFLAWDLNPMHWLLFTTTLGRIGAVIMALSYINAVIEYYYDN